MRAGLYFLARKPDTPHVFLHVEASGICVLQAILTPL
jgi:hypothetical protein